MKKELKDRWVAALRSGKYAQGRGALRASAGKEGEDDQYCCLGVLCDLADPSGWNGPAPSTPSIKTMSCRLGVLSISGPGLQELGLGRHLADELATLNDGGCLEYPHGFPFIANFIQENVPEE